MTTVQHVKLYDRDVKKKLKRLEIYNIYVQSSLEECDVVTGTVTRSWKKCLRKIQK